MTSLTRNIIDFYKVNKSNTDYLTKNFSTTSALGLYEPHGKNAIAKYGDPKKGFVGTIDRHNDYEINHLGFRGTIDPESDILASGCSITFGIGVPENGRWTNFLSNSLNKSVTNLGSPGASIQSICTNIIQYALNNKMPKEIFCLMPDFFRRMVVVDKEFYISKNYKSFGANENLESIYCNPTILMHGINSMFMEISDTKYVEDSISPHQLILDSVNAIYILESFCSTNGIKLYWTTWDLPTHWILLEMLKIKDFKLKRYTPFLPDTPNGNVNTFVRKTCKLDHGSELKDGPCWHTGSDYFVINGKAHKDQSHPGAHFQYHLAELFYNLHNKELSL